MSSVDDTQQRSPENILNKYGYKQEFRRELKRFASFAIGFSFISITTYCYWPVVILALIWLVFELSIFRDASFKTPWLYTLVMFFIGLVYFVYMVVAKPHLLKTQPLTEGEEGPETPPERQPEISV